MGAALEAHDDLDIQAQHPERQRRHQVQRGGALAAEAQLLLLQLVEILGQVVHAVRGGNVDHAAGRRRRSEEHTSELQSLMRISYAVFCLKKKNTTYNEYVYTQPH